MPGVYEISTKLENKIYKANVKLNDFTNTFKVSNLNFTIDSNYSDSDILALLPKIVKDTNGILILNQKVTWSNKITKLNNDYKIATGFLEKYPEIKIQAKFKLKNEEFTLDLNDNLFNTQTIAKATYNQIRNDAINNVLTAVPNSSNRWTSWQKK